MKWCCTNTKRTYQAMIIAIGLTCTVLSNIAFAEQNDRAAAEKMFRGAVSAILDNRPDAALTIAADSLEIKPDLRVTEILRADLLAAYAHQKPLMAMPQALQQRRIIGLRDEMLARFTHRLPAAGHLPLGILQLSPRHRLALVLDAAQSRLYVFRNTNGRPMLVSDYYASIGNGGMNKTAEGDSKTPTGIYKTVAFLEDDELPELYGVGAYTLDYPNQWDKQSNHGGYGIWIHGMPRSLSSRPPQDSRGCIILDNADIAELRQYVDDAKAPVLLSPRVIWLEEQAWQAQRNQLLLQVRSWQQDWESMDTEQYLSYYAPEYVTATQSYQQMLTRSRINARKKTFIKVAIEDLDLFVHPGRTDVVQMVFDQDYQSNDYSIRYRKKQIWRLIDGDWKIVYEGRFD